MVITDTWFLVTESELYPMEKRMAPFTENPILVTVAAIVALLVFSSLHVPAIAATLGFMPPTLPDLLLAVAGGILLRMVRSPLGAFYRKNGGAVTSARQIPVGLRVS
jgi:hypothetical protein